VLRGEPLRHHGVGPGSVVGVVGLGGLGHLAVTLAKAMGAEVAVFTTSDSKAGPALELGADEAVLSSDAEQMAVQRGRFDRRAVRQRRQVQQIVCIIR
jgi:uncharacterized zinc-type alcohol dehydrogenase-like protein